MLIDTAIRDWVLLPLIFLVILVHFTRTFLLKLVTSESAVPITEMQQK